MKILLATDGSPHSQAAAPVLQRLAFPASSALTILTVIAAEALFTTPEDPTVAAERNVLDQFDAARRQEAAQVLEQEAARFAATGWRIRTLLREGDIAEQIIAAAEELSVELVAVGARGLSGMERFLLGSVSHKIVKYAPCGVLVARGTGAVADDAAAPTAGARWRILLAYDASPSAQAAVDGLAALPLGEHVEVTVVTVLPLITAYRMDIVQQLGSAWQEKKRQAQTRLDSVAQTLRRATPHVTALLRENADPSEALLQEAQTGAADLIIMGHKGHSAIERFLLGSVAHRIAYHAPCSVWLVRA